MDFKCVIKKENGEFIEGTIEGKNGHQYIIDVDNNLIAFDEKDVFLSADYLTKCDSLTLKIIL